MSEITLKKIYEMVLKNNDNWDKLKSSNLPAIDLITKKSNCIGRLECLNELIEYLTKNP